MGGIQLPLFLRKTYKAIISEIVLAQQAPAGDRTVLQVLPAYSLYLKDGGFSKYTPDDFTGDVKKFGVLVKEKHIQDIAEKDVQAWISHLRAPVLRGEGLQEKTVSRKLTALANFFNWLIVSGAVRAYPSRRIRRGQVLASKGLLSVDDPTGIGSKREREPDAKHRKFPGHLTTAGYPI